MNKRWAIWYHNNFGRNDGSPLYYYNLMKNKLGIDVTHLMPEGDVTRFGKFDYHLWVDYGEDGLPTDKQWRLPEDGGKKIYISSDCHIDEEGKNYRFSKANQFDYVFFNQLRALEEWSKDEENGSNKGIIADWLPHAAEPDVYKSYNKIKKYDICFIGHMQEVENFNGMTRLDFLDTMFKEFPNFYFGTRHISFPGKNMFEDAAERFCESKVVLNICINDDINMRVFETLSTGSFLLTDRIPTLKLIGKEGEHFECYDSIEEAIEKTKYYIKHDDEREKIAKAGYKLFMEGHTYEHRFKKILDIIGEADGDKETDSGGDTGLHGDESQNDGGDVKE